MEINMDNAVQPHCFWEKNVQHIKCESTSSIEELHRLRDERTLYNCCDGNLNFATAPCSEDETDYSNTAYKKNKTSRQDPMSHRIIEKRRRDRMNNCLADLSQLIPAEYLKKGRGRIEKTEIIEMAIKYMKHLQNKRTKVSENFSLGYQECMSETMRFLVEVEGRFLRETICIRLLNHLQKHSESLLQTHESKTKEPLDTCNDSAHKIHTSQNVASKNNTDEQGINEESNNNNYHESNNNNYPADDENTNTRYSDLDTSDKQSDNGSASYKYKTNIKLRFSQDLNSAAKRQRCDNDTYDGSRRASVTSLENYSSSHSSPPSCSGDLLRSSTENETFRPTSIPSHGYNQKADIKILPTRQTQNHVNHIENKVLEHKNNFNVPIFVLHAKGSFYVPLTIDYFTLVPFLQNYSLLDIHSNMQNLILHPVTINVNFRCNNVVKK